MIRKRQISGNLKNRIYSEEAGPDVPNEKSFLTMYASPVHARLR